jgi:hypothetical protein
MEERNCPSSRHRIVGVTPGIELAAAQLNIAALPGTTTESCGSTVNSSSDTPVADKNISYKLTDHQYGGIISSLTPEILDDFM